MTFVRNDGTKYILMVRMLTAIVSYFELCRAKLLFWRNFNFDFVLCLLYNINYCMKISSFSKNRIDLSYRGAVFTEIFMKIILYIHRYCDEICFRYT